MLEVLQVIYSIGILNTPVKKGRHIIIFFTSIWVNLSATKRSKCLKWAILELYIIYREVI